MAAPSPSRLDANQVLQGSYDEDRGRLRVDSESTIVNADIDVALDATEDNVAIADPSGDFLEIESDGSINVNSVDGALESTQQQVLSELQDVNSELDAIGLDVDAIRVATQSIDSDIDVPLSTRASEATQVLNNTELVAVNSELDSITSQLILANSSLDDIEARLETFDTNYGTVGANTLRVAAQIGNSTGAASFNAGTTGAQTLRTTSNITRNGTELDYNLGAPSANTIRTASATADRSGNGISSKVYGTQQGLTISHMDGPQVDSFSRIRTSSITSLFNAYFSNSPHDLLFEDIITGGASITHSTTESSMLMNVGTASGDRIVRQTRRYVHYNPGRSYLVTISGVFGSGLENQTRRWGYYDDNNGLFFQLTGTTFSIVRRTSVSGSPVDVVINQSSFNIDTLDGLGPSGLTINTATHHLYVIDYIWQGAGKVRFGVILNGNLVYCHEIISDNVLNNPFMRTPALPVRVEMFNTGTTLSSATIKYTCISISKESSDDTLPTYVFAANRGTSSVTVGAGATLPVLSIRPKLTFAGITNRVPVFPKEAPMISISNPLLVSLFLNPTLTGASFVSANSNSSVEYDLSATAVTGGQLVKTFFVGGLSGQSAVTSLVELSNILFLGLNISGSTANILSIVVTNLGSGNTAVNAGFVWEEYQ